METEKKEQLKKKLKSSEVTIQETKNYCKVRNERLGIEVELAGDNPTAELLGLAEYVFRNFFNDVKSSRIPGVD